MKSWRHLSERLAFLSELGLNCDSNSECQRSVLRRADRTNSLEGVTPPGRPANGAALSRHTAQLSCSSDATNSYSARSFPKYTEAISRWR